MPDNTFSITGCNLFDGTSAPTRKNVTIKVRESRVEEITPGESAPSGTASARPQPQRPDESTALRARPDGTTETVYDGRGLTVLPGLIDMHVHICLNPAGRYPPEELRGSESETLAWMMLNASRNLQEALGAGITTLRDLGTGMNVSIFLKRARQRGEVLGPHLHVAGAMITATGGHGMELGLGVEADGVDEVRKVVRRELSKGADLVKLVTSGVYTPTHLTLEELR